MKEGSEYVKFVTVKLVDYMETPRVERKRSRREARAVRAPWYARWFGLAGTGFVLWLAGRKLRREAAPAEEAESAIEAAVGANEVQRDKPHPVLLTEADG